MEEEFKCAIDNSVSAVYDFRPKDDMTLAEVVQLLKGLGITFTETASSEIPESLKRHYVKRG
jgi:hypothetical protein